MTDSTVSGAAGRDTDTALIPAAEVHGLPAVPSLFADNGERCVRRVVEWLTAEIRNPHTRASYVYAIRRFAEWCQVKKLRLADLTPVHAAVYIEELGTAVRENGRPLSKPTIKQNLAALKMLGDYLVTGQIIPANPFGPVRGPKHTVKKGKTAVLTVGEMRRLINSIELTVNEDGRPVEKSPEQFTIAELRDRALIALLAYSFARISAVLGMAVEDFDLQGDRRWLRLHEKGGKYHQVPCHPKAREYLDAFIAAARIAGDRAGPLFRRLDRRRRLTRDRLLRREALAMVKRRAQVAGLSEKVCCHSFRATGITVYLQNGGTIEKAQAIAAHESPRTTKLYDRTSDAIDASEIDRIAF